MKCFNLLREMVVMVVEEGYQSMLDAESSTRTPLSVLDRRFTKWECQNITTAHTTVGSEKRDIKRRKMNGVSYQMKQIQQSSREWGK
jgi:cyclin D6